MKKASDPRHQRRIKALKSLFAWDFNQAQSLDPFAQKVIKNLDKVDPLIKKSAPMRPIEQINKIDLAILRLTVYELVIDKSAPYKVIVDEAVELAKSFGSESSSAFVNGALGHLIKEAGLES